MTPNEDIGIGEVVRTLRRIELLLDNMVIQSVYKADWRTQQTINADIQEDIADLKDWKRKMFYGLGALAASMFIVIVTVVLQVN